jgi:putative DNA primase/helicase
MAKPLLPRPNADRISKFSGSADAPPWEEEQVPPDELSHREPSEPQPAAEPSEPPPAAEVCQPWGVPIKFTQFPSEQAKTQRKRTAQSLAQLANHIRKLQAPTKPELPWIKLARFSGVPSDKDCLRYDEAVIELCGAELDYDGGQLSITEAAERLSRTGVAALLYETPSSTPEKPRWRVLCPASRRYTGTTDELRARRAQWVARINGVVGGGIDGASFNLSQAFYAGTVEGKPPVTVIITEGARIDTLDSLDAGAIYKNGHAEPTRRTEHAPVPDALTDSDDDPELIEEGRSRVANHLAKYGLGTAPNGQSRIPAGLLLSDTRTSDGAILSAEAIAELIEDACPTTRLDHVMDMLARRENPRGCELIGLEPEPEGEPSVTEVQPTPRAAPQTPHSTKPQPDVSHQHKKITFQRGSDCILKKIDWVWPGWLARGKYHALAGPKGSGKSTIVFSLFAAITAGLAFPDGTKAPIGDVLVWSAEDDIADTILPRIAAAGGNLDRVYTIAPVKGKDGHERDFDPSCDTAELTRAARQLPGLVAVLIDPVVMAVGGDSHKNAETRRGLQPLVNFAQERNIALIGLTHFSKGTEGKDPVDRVTGSLAFGALARVVWGAVADAEGEQRRLVRIASNIGPSGGGFEYTVYQEPLESYDFSAQRIAWGHPIKGAAHDLLADLAGERGVNKVDAAKAFLIEMLKDGPRSSKDLRAAAEAHGISWRAVERAKEKMPQIKVTQTVGAPAGGWGWQLVTAETENPAALKAGSKSKEVEPQPTQLRSGRKLPRDAHDTDERGCSV